MTLTPRSKLQSLLAAEFDRQGWQYELTTGQRLIDALEAQGEVDGGQLANALPSEFFQRNRTTKELVALAIERSIGGLSVEQEGATEATIVIQDNRYQVNLGPGARIVHSNMNVGEGVQINVDLEASKEDVLGGVEAILRAALGGDWNPEAANALASVIEDRNDVDLDDVRRITVEVVEDEQPKRGRVKTLLGQIATSGVGGALGTGMSSGLGELLSQLPL